MAQSKTTGKPQKKPSKQKLTVRERKFIKGLMEGKTPSQAMREAGYTESTARVKSSAKVAELQPTIQALMEKRGLTDNRFLEVLERGLESTKVISCNIVAVDKEGMKDADSMTKDFIDVPDFATQHKYMETGLKLKGHLRDKLDVTLTDNLSDRLRDARERTKTQS